MYSSKAEAEPDIRLTYKTASGIALPMNIYYPKTGDDNCPVMLCIHGGGWTSLTESPVKWQGNYMKHQARYYAQRGFVGVEISYRSIKIDGLNVFDLMQDCHDAFEYMVKNLKRADLNRIFIIGDSAGGHLALELAFDEGLSVTPFSVIACNPVTDLTEKSWVYTAATEEERVKASPMYNIKPIKTDVFVMHGTMDNIVDIADSIRFVELMKRAGNSCRMETVCNTHAFILYEYKNTDETVGEYMSIVDEYIEAVMKKG